MWLLNRQTDAEQTLSVSGSFKLFHLHTVSVCFTCKVTEDNGLLSNELTCWSH